MTRAEAKAAMDAGKKIGWFSKAYEGHYCYLDVDSIFGPYVHISPDGIKKRMEGAWDNLSGTFAFPRTKPRPCNDLEILAIVTKPNRVVKRKEGGHTIFRSQSLNLHSENAKYYQWAEFDADGNLGPWHDFVMEVEE